jgi:hypothetical protein
VETFFNFEFNSGVSGVGGVVMVSDVKAAGRPDAGKPASDWDNRRLCSDGNCIGVIGADGRCKECGRAYSG